MSKNPKMPISRKNGPYPDFSAIDDFESSSARECTGLIPAAPENDYEVDSYKEIFDYSPDTIIHDKNH